eukprot:1590240-Amphidinium_carterae.1
MVWMHSLQQPWVRRPMGKEARPDQKFLLSPDSAALLWLASAVVDPFEPFPSKPRAIAFEEIAISH